MDHIENCLQFNWFFAAHLDTFNLFHRARNVIRGLSKNELQRRGLFYKMKGDILIKITQSGMNQTPVQRGMMG